MDGGKDGDFTGKLGAIPAHRPILLVCTALLFEDTLLKAMYCSVDHCPHLSLLPRTRPTLFNTTCLSPVGTRV